MLTLHFDTRMVVLIGLALITVGAFLPWSGLPALVSGDLARWGLTGGGFATLAMGLAGLISLLFPWRLLRRAALPAAALACLAYLAALGALVNVVKTGYSVALAPGAYPGAIGSGLYITLIGALTAAVGGLWPAELPAQAAASPPAQGPTRLALLPLAILAGILPLMCACAILIGLALGPISGIIQPGEQFTVQPTAAPFPAELLATPLIDVQVTLWQATPAPPTAAPPTFPLPTPLPTLTRTPSPTPSPTATTTPWPSPLETPEPGK